MEDKQPLISVVIAVYNICDYVGKCLESIVAQSYSNLEIIAVNDGSTDGSLAVLQHFASADSRIKIVDKPNGGLVMARRDGLLASSGDLVFFMDGDDYISADCIEKLCGALERNRSDMASARLIRVKENYASLAPGGASGCLEGREYLRGLMSHGIFAYFSSKLCRRQVLEGLRFHPEIAMWEDFIFSLQIALNPAFRSVCFTDDAYYFYVQRPGSMRTDRDNFEYIGRFEAIVDEILLDHPGRVEDIYILAEKVMRYGIYISKGRNPWRGDRSPLAAICEAAAAGRKALKKVIPAANVDMAVLYRKKSNRWIIRMISTLRRWSVSLRRRTSHRVDLDKLVTAENPE